MFDIGKTVTAGDVALFVSETGKADGEPIVLLHGGGWGAEAISFR